MINEPTAASLAYGFQEQAQSNNRHVLIFDFGGGTFDVTIVQIKDCKYQVIATGGNDHLGGEDLDNALVQYMAKKFEEEHGVDITKMSASLSRLKIECEKAKLGLSSSAECNVYLPGLIKEPKRVDWDTTITRGEFESACQPHFDATI